MDGGAGLGGGNPKADIGASGPVDGMGNAHDLGSYVNISVDEGKVLRRYRISRGQAELLAMELLAIVNRKPA